MATSTTQAQPGILWDPYARRRPMPTRYELEAAAGDPKDVEEMIAGALRAWPEAARAIHLAAAHVRKPRNVIERRSYTGQPGDWWKVGDRSCSIAKNNCNCGEAAHDDPKMGRLCSHRIAAMFQRRIYQHNAARLEKLIRYIVADDEGRRDSNGAEVSMSQIVIVYDLYFNDTGEHTKQIAQIGTNRSALIGIEKIDINNEGIEAAANATGWTIEEPRRKGTLSMILKLTPTTEQNPPRTMDTLLGIDRSYLAQRDEANARRERIGAYLDATITANAAALDAAAD